MSVLEKIEKSVRQKLEERKMLISLAELELACSRQSSKTLGKFESAFNHDSLGVIAEVKFASPSQGEIHPLIDPSVVAQDYLAYGASAISVLTEEQYFKGSLSNLVKVRKALPDARILMKDFVLERYQLLEGFLAGADAVLLILSLLGEERVRELHHEARALGLDVLVEVHDQEELSAAKRIGARLIGINNRSLITLEVSLETSFKLMSEAKKTGLTETALLISESGIGSSSEVSRLHAAGFSGILVGTSLMKTQNPGLALSELLKGRGA